MQETNSTFMQGAKSKSLTYIVQIVGLLVILLNIFIASKLAPIAQDIAVIATRVEALEAVVVPKSEVELQLKEINRRLEGIENKLGVVQ